MAPPDHKRRQSSRRGPSHRHARPGTPVFRPASPAPRAKLPSPLPAWRCRTTSAARTGLSHRHARPGTPVFRPASPAPRAKLPSPLPARRRRIRNAASPPGGGLHTGTPAQERRPPHRHRPLRGRNSRRPSRPGAAGSGTPPVLPAGPFTPARPPGTPVFRPASPAPRAKLAIAPPRTAPHKINSHRPSRPGAAGSGTPPVLPVGAFHTGPAPRRPGVGTPVFRPASPAPRAKLPSPLPARRRTK